jgi:membrane protease YdiL (CAAX protease family)
MLDAVALSGNPVDTLAGAEPVAPALPLGRSRLQELAAGGLGLGLAMALYGNAFALLDALTRLHLGGTVGGVGLGLAAVAIAARDGRGWLIGLGLHRHGLLTSLLLGLMLGLAMGLPGALYFLSPDLAPVPVRHEELRGAGASTFLMLVLVQIPFATALAEELAFRGLLQARLRAAFGPARAVLLGSIVFAAWHLVVNARTLQDTGLGAEPAAAVLVYLGQIVAVFIGGLLFALLRERSGNLAGCVVAHWLTDVLLLAGLYFA